jgi:hypothetical protein
LSESTPCTLEPNDQIHQVYLLGAYLFSLDSRLLQFLVPQASNPPFLTSPQARRAPLSFLPDILALLFFLIHPPLVSLPLSWVIIDLIYF